MGCMGGCGGGKSSAKSSPRQMPKNWGGMGSSKGGRFKSGSGKSGVSGSSFGTPKVKMSFGSRGR